MYIVVSGHYDTKSKFWKEGTVVEEIPPGANPNKFRPVGKEKKHRKRGG